MVTAYTRFFYRVQRAGSLASASHVVPILLDLVGPRSVADVGCGIGTWLSVFRQNGVDDIFGVDGDYIDRRMLLIPESAFANRNLNEPFDLGRRFDLAISLEVAEHLQPRAARNFIGSLTKASPVVAFSAAIPGQGGVSHVNEQWPEYWRDLFEERDFVLVDCLREAIWDNPAVEIWYRQNLLLFVDRQYLSQHPRLREVWKSKPGRMISVVHPEMFRYRLTKPGLIETLQRLPGSVVTGIRRCMGRV